MLAVLFALSFAVTVRSQTTVNGQRDGLVFNCAGRKTIEQAYWDYCPSTTSGGNGNLAGVNGYTDYTNAPSSYQTQVEGFELFCGYSFSGGLREDITCRYIGGGGQALELVAGSDPDCPPVSSTVPQPSPGYDYRRRALQRRATAGRVPTFTCPFDSNDATTYVFNTDVSSGNFATENGMSAGYVVNSDQVFYACAVSPDIACYYVQNPGDTVVFLGSSPNDDVSECPQTLCAVDGGSGTPTKRGVYLEGNQARIARNQANPRSLRRGSSFGR